MIARQEGTEEGASGGDPGAPFSLPVRSQMSLAVPGGLCIGRSCADALGAWGLLATNKRNRVYTCALLATTIQGLY